MRNVTKKSRLFCGSHKISVILKTLCVKACVDGHLSEELVDANSYITLLSTLSVVC